MADVQLLDLRDGGHRTNVPDREAVSGVDRQTEVRPASRRVTKRIERRAVPRLMRVGSGVKLNRWNAELLRLLDRCPGWIDEEAHPDTRVGQGIDRVLNARRLTQDVQPALRRHFFPSLGYQCHLLWADAPRYLQHLGDARHLQVE